MKLHVSGKHILAADSYLYAKYRKFVATGNKLSEARIFYGCNLNFKYRLFIELKAKYFPQCTLDTNFLNPRNSQCTYRFTNFQEVRLIVGY